ncbi:hypothetical protein B0H13DRAFT_1891764 [Mycena leptocephala]|nr:hypothetical protein B0H13DRAFT_1891764 [Mycena leptocephala]
MTAGRTDSRGAHGTESISIAKKVHPMSIARLTCSLAHWLNRRSPRTIHNPSAKSIEEETGMKKQKSPRRVPVQRVRTSRRGQNKTKSETEQKDRRRHDLDRGGMGYMLAQRDASKSDRGSGGARGEKGETGAEGMRIDTAGNRERIQCGSHTERERSEIEWHATAWVPARRQGWIAHECTSTGRATCTARAGQGGWKQACTTSAKIVREG